MNRLSEDQARDVYSVLTAEAGASEDPNDANTFVREFSGAKPSNEWRFIGSLGFGGKFRFPGLTVDFYPEDATPERRAAVERTNAKLAALRMVWTTSNVTASN